MTVALYVVICAAALAFVAASAVRAVTYARSPIHLRWELYPVPHERPERAMHGGSYFEASEWWRTPRHVSLAGEWKFMIPEILLLRGLREYNRPLWFRSFPFHFGLYLLAGTTGLVCVMAAAIVVGAAATGGALAGTVRWVSSATGAAGILLVIGGAIGLLHRRLTDPALTPYTTPGDVFNLLFFIAAIGLAGVGYIASPAGSPDALSIAAGLLSWDTTLQVSVALGSGLIAVALLAAYIPLTHMSHFIAKYFTYHRVRWDDAPAAGNRRIAAAMAAYLSRKPTWAADHVKADGTTTWGDIASSNPARETER